MIFLMAASRFWNFSLAARRFSESEASRVDQVGGDAVVLVVGPLGDVVELQGVVHLPFAELGLVEDGGDVDVGLDPSDLGAVAVGPVELLDRQLEGPHASARWSAGGTRR